jgi:hypothetical protein
MQAKEMDIETIHESLVNGQRKQMADQIDEYGLYNFWSDYADYLGRDTPYSIMSQLAFFHDAVISYHRITNR